MRSMNLPVTRLLEGTGPDWLCLNRVQTRCGQNFKILNMQILFNFICDETIMNYTRLEGKTLKTIQQ